MGFGPPPFAVSPLRFSPSITIPRNFIGSMFTDNSLIYYKTGSLATAGTNTVKNSRAVARRT